MNKTGLNLIAWRLGRLIGFCWYPATFLIVAYGAWLAAELTGGR